MREPESPQWAEAIEAARKYFSAAVIHAQTVDDLDRVRRELNKWHKEMHKKLWREGGK